VSRHWKPDRRGEWTVIDGYASGASARGGMGPIVVSAVLVGLAAGGALSWTARNAGPEPEAAIEWNAVQPVPTRAPDAQDVAWEKRANGRSPVLASDRDVIQDGSSVKVRRGDAPDPLGLPRAAGARNDIYVIDGDTFSYRGQRVRIAGIDAPETHPPRCIEEARLGLAATQRLKQLLGSGTVTVSGADHDQYGRALRSVQVNGQDVGKAMTSAGMARSYDGKKRRPWC
jgi:micrococcal nuclease